MSASAQREEAERHNARELEMGELGVAFRRVWRSIGRLRGRDTHLGPGELSHAQFELLLELDERGELSVGELASAARMAPGTVTQMLDTLAASGHVERARSRSDQRVVVSRLTPQGLARIEAKRAAWKERWERALGDVPTDDLRTAAAVLERLGEMIESSAPQGACERPDPGSESELAGGAEAGGHLL